MCHEIQVTPLTAVAPNPTRGALAEQGAQIGRNAVVGEFVVMETMSESTTWRLLRAEALAAPVPTGYVCPDLSCDVELDYPRLKQVVLVSRLKPVLTGRSPSTRMFGLGTALVPFLVPCHLLCAPLKSMPLRSQPRRSTSSTESSSSSTSSEARSMRFEMPVASKAAIYGRCRIF